MHEDARTCLIAHVGVAGAWVRVCALDGACVCVCVCVYVCVHIHACMYMCMRVCLCVGILRWCVFRHVIMC